MLSVVLVILGEVDELKADEEVTLTVEMIADGLVEESRLLVDSLLVGGLLVDGLLMDRMLVDGLPLADGLVVVNGLLVVNGAACEVTLVYGPTLVNNAAGEDGVAVVDRLVLIVDGLLTVGRLVVTILEEIEEGGILTRA